MCTVIVEVPTSADRPTRLLAVRDEDPSRPWNPLGAWWADTHPGVVGVRDQRAGGAWLAARPGGARLAVLLNRAEISGLPAEGLRSRGELPLAAVEGAAATDDPNTHGFNLVSVDAGETTLTTWDGAERRSTGLAPGTHMIAHDGLDDRATARIARWLDDFRDATGRAPSGGDEDWFGPWLDVLAASGDFSPTDDRAIIRDNRPHGYPTLSLLLCTATIGPSSTAVRYGELSQPGVWERVELV